MAQHRMDSDVFFSVAILISLVISGDFLNGSDHALWVFQSWTVVGRLLDG